MAFVVHFSSVDGRWVSSPYPKKKNPGLSQSLVLPCVCHCIFRLFLNDFYMRSTNSGFIWMLFIKLCLQYCSTVYMYSVFCLKNEQRHQGPPLPGLEAESSLGAWKETLGIQSLNLCIYELFTRQGNALPFKIEGKSFMCSWSSQV